MERYSWKPVLNNKPHSSRPSPRWGHSSCVIKDEIILFGGYADSIYMNDLWIYNTELMQWTQIKTTGSIPSQRSNSSLHYDEKNNRIIMFGGGGSNKTRFNSIHSLDWSTKCWSQLNFNQNQNAPWERTYHSSQLLYPYLIVYGGEGIADLDDLWIFNLQSEKWNEITTKNCPKPCGRRFHSSCLIGNTFFVIAGCYSKYRPLSDVFSIDLTTLLETGKFDDLKWKQIVFKGSSFLTRWGHACSSLERKIYIFGGRFSNDLNDILVLDTEAMKMKTLKTPSESIPKPRRRACINFVGNCLLMFGGFNSQYFNDLHYINVSDGLEKPKKYTRLSTQLLGFINNKETSDFSLQSTKGSIIYCHKGLMMHNFESQNKFFEFMREINGKESENSLIQILECLYKGFGKNQTITKLLKSFPSCQQQKESLLIKELEKLDEKVCPLRFSSSNIFSKQNIIKIINNNIIELGDDQFGQFLERNREMSYKDIDFIVNDRYVLKSNNSALACGSKFFKNLLKGKFIDSQSKVFKIWVPNGNVVLVEAILNFLTLGMLVLPQNMSYQSWLQLYELSDYFNIKELISIVVYVLSLKLSESNVDEILSFSTKFRIEKLAISCARMKLRMLQKQPQIENMYLKRAYIQNRFQIKQKMIQKEDTSLKKKESNISTEGQKQNYQVNNE